MTSYIVADPGFAGREHGLFKERADAIYKLTSVASVHMKKGRRGLLALVRNLKAGGVLNVAMDSGRGDPGIRVAAAGGTLALYDGAIRMAILHKALLVPATIVEQRALRYTVTFGRPVPGHLLAGNDIQGAANHMVGEILPLLESNPGSLNWSVMEAFCPNERSQRRAWP